MLKIIITVLASVLYLALWKPELNWLILPIEFIGLLLVISIIWEEEKDTSTTWIDVINAYQRKNGKFDNDIKRIEQITLSPFKVIFISLILIIIGGILWIRLI